MSSSVNFGRSRAAWAPSATDSDRLRTLRVPPKEVPLIFHGFGTPPKVGIQGLRRITAGLVKVAFLMKIKVLSWKGCQIREMRILCLPGGLKILCNCMQFACNVVRTFQGLNHRFNTPAGGLAAWWRIETWAREGRYSFDPTPWRRKARQSRARPGSPVDR